MPVLGNCSIRSSPPPLLSYASSFFSWVVMHLISSLLFLPRTTVRMCSAGRRRKGGGKEGPPQARYYQASSFPPPALGQWDKWARDLSGPAGNAQMLRKGLKKKTNGIRPNIRRKNLIVIHPKGRKEEEEEEAGRHIFFRNTWAQKSGRGEGKETC